MAVTLTMTWAGGISSNDSCGFVLTTDDSVEEVVSYPRSAIQDIKNPVHRAVAKELSEQAGSATGTVTVSIA
jgi:hypothetical protein